MFMTTFTRKALRANISPSLHRYPGKIIAMHPTSSAGEMICQRDSFLCAARGIQINIAFQKKFGVGLLRRRRIHHAAPHWRWNRPRPRGRNFDGTRVESGGNPQGRHRCIVALQPSVNYDIQMVGGIKNPSSAAKDYFSPPSPAHGKIWLQSLPFSRLAAESSPPRAVEKMSDHCLGTSGDSGDRIKTPT